MYKRPAAVLFVICLLIGIADAKILIIQQQGVDSVALSGHSISTVVSESRGMIYDCNLRPLVNCSSTEYIAVKPLLSAFNSISDLIPSEAKSSVLNEITCGRIGIFKSNKKISDSNAVSFSLVDRYEEDGLCVHTVGYINSALEGVCGIEKYYNNILSNEKGSLKIICDIDARRNALEGEPLKVQSDNYSSDAGVALTVDKDIQLICELALKKFNIEKGAAVVLDVETSEIRAIASVPEFSQINPAESLDNENAPFINRAITAYSVGSVFKVVVSAAALEKGIGTALSYNCAGKIKVGEQEFSCHRKTGHGTLDMYSATAQSCNPYFINLALLTGKNEVCSMARNLGLGKSIELCDGWYSPSGVLPSEADLVSQQDLANLAFGQGSFLASPLQMAAVYAAIANDGIYRTPSLMQSALDKNKVEVLRAELPANRRVMSSKTAKLIKKMLLETVEKGSGKSAKPDKIDAAGKTATAQSGEFNEQGKEILRAWFCGFFPYSKPKYAVAILKEDGSGGAVDCAPVFKYIADCIAEIQ